MTLLPIPLCCDRHAWRVQRCGLKALWFNRIMKDSPMTQRAFPSVFIFSSGFYSRRWIFSALAVILVPLTVLVGLLLILPQVSPQARWIVTVLGGGMGLLLTLGGLLLARQIEHDVSASSAARPAETPHTTKVDDMDQTEADLRDSQTNLLAVMEHTQDGIASIDRRGRVLVANSVFKRMLFEVYGVNLDRDQDACPKDLPDALRALWQRTGARAMKGEAVTEEFHHTLGGGEAVLESSFNPIIGEDGRVQGVSIFVRNITGHKQAHALLRQRGQMQQLIARISTEFINLRSHEMDSAVQSALAEVGMMVGVDRSYIFCYRTDGSGLVDSAYEWCAAGIPSHKAHLQGMPRHAFAWWRESMRSQKRVFIRSLTDLPEDATKERELYSALDARSLIAVPLGIGDQELGFVGFDSVRRQIDWDEESIALLQLLGDIFVSAFQRRQTEDALADERLSLARRVEERTAELEIQYGREAALASIEPNIGQPDDLAGVLNRMVELAAEVLGTTGASVLLRDMETDRFATISATPALRPAQEVMTWVRQEGGATRWIATHRQPLVVTDREDAALLSALPIPLNPMMAEAGLRAFAGVPLMAQDEVVGVLYVLNKDARQFSSAEMDFLFALARRGALAVSNVQLYKTLQQANHELARAARLKDDFLASMSHELRTPLNAILGMSESLLEEIYGPISEEQHYPIQAVRESGRNLLALINDILDLSRIEAGQAEIYLEQVHIPSVCQGSLQFVQQKAMKRQIKINIDVAEDVQHHATPVWADERRLKQILVNLLSNAVKFTPEGERSAWK